MKQIVVWIMAVVFFASCSTLTPQEKEAAKAQQNAQDMAWYNLAVDAVKARDFVLEADRIDFKRGNFVYVQPSVNFVAVKDNRATVQLAFSHRMAGPNGIGGITVEGLVSNAKYDEDKKGNITYSMMVQGTGISAQVIIKMIKGTNKCTATVTPNFNSNRISFTGNMYPTEESNVFKGRSL